MNLRTNDWTDWLREEWWWWESMRIVMLQWRDLWLPHVPGDGGRLN